MSSTASDSEKNYLPQEPTVTTRDVDEETYQYTAEQVEAYVIDPAIARSVTRKMDVRILPLCICMYFFSALDRGNLGNAKTDGLNEDIGLVGNQYNMILTAVSVTFATCAIAGGYLTKRFGPPRMLPLYMMGWGSMALINAATMNFGGMVAVRFFLGMFEGFFGPSITIYLSSFYTRGQMGKRMALWYSSASLSGAFSGLLSFGVFQLNTNLHGWQILFLIEGGLTVMVACIAPFILPGYPKTCKFLTHKEKEVATMRLLKDASGVVDAKFNNKAFFAPIRQPRLYAYGLFALCYGTAAGTANYFLPQIIGRFGLSKIKTNLYTVGPNLVAIPWIIGNCWVSDIVRNRGWFLIGANSTVLVGCIIMTTTPVSALGPGYFATYLIAMGANVPTCMFHTWHNNNDPDELARAFRTGFLTFCANAGSLISANVFLDSDAPKYQNALIASACLQVLAIILISCIDGQMWWENRKRNKAQGVNWTTLDVPTADLIEGPKNPKFRYFL